MVASLLQELLLVGLTLYIRRRVAKGCFTISLLHALALGVNTFWGRKAICPRPQQRLVCVYFLVFAGVALG